jgi:hypothetical protein
VNYFPSGVLHTWLIWGKPFWPHWYIRGSYVYACIRNERLGLQSLNNGFLRGFLCLAWEVDRKLFIGGRKGVIPSHGDQGCQMVYLQPKNSNLGRFWRALQWKMLV